MTTPKHTTAPKGAEVPPGQDRVPDAAYSNQLNQAQAEQERKHLAARELELQEKQARQRAVDFFLDRCLGLEHKKAELHSEDYKPHDWEARARQFICAVAQTPDAPDALVRILAADLRFVTINSARHRGSLTLGFHAYGAAAAVHHHAPLLARVLRRTGLLRNYPVSRGGSDDARIERIWLTDDYSIGELHESFLLGSIDEYDRTCWFDLNSSGQIVEETDG